MKYRGEFEITDFQTFVVGRLERIERKLDNLTKAPPQMHIVYWRTHDRLDDKSRVYGKHANTARKWNSDKE